MAAEKIYLKDIKLENNFKFSLKKHFNLFNGP